MSKWKGYSDFEEKVLDSVKWEQKVGGMLRLQGFDILMKAVRIASVKEAYNFSGSDIYLMCDSGKKLPLEVKSQKYAFTGLKDYPYAKPAVNSLNAWQRKAEEPLAVIFISTITEACLVIPIYRGIKLFPGTRHDKSRGVTYKTIDCNKTDMISFEEFVKDLQTTAQEMNIHYSEAI